MHPKRDYVYPGQDFAETYSEEDFVAYYQQKDFIASQKCPGSPESTNYFGCAAKDLPENARFSLCEEPTLPFSPNPVELYSLPAYIIVRGKQTLPRG